MSFQSFYSWPCLVSTHKLNFTSSKRNSFIRLSQPNTTVAQPAQWALPYPHLLPKNSNFSTPSPPPHLLLTISSTPSLPHHLLAISPPLIFIVSPSPTTVSSIDYPHTTSPFCPTSSHHRKPSQHSTQKISYSTFPHHGGPCLTNTHTKKRNTKFSLPHLLAPPRAVLTFHL